MEMCRGRDSPHRILAAGWLTAKIKIAISKFYNPFPLANSPLQVVACLVSKCCRYPFFFVSFLYREARHCYADFCTPVEEMRAHRWSAHRQCGNYRRDNPEFRDLISSKRRAPNDFFFTSWIQQWRCCSRTCWVNQYNIVECIFTLL